MLRELGPHPEDGAPVWLKTGHYGPFVAHRRRSALLPPNFEPDAGTRAPRGRGRPVRQQDPAALTAGAAGGRGPVYIVGLRSWNAEAGAAALRPVVILDAGLPLAGR